MSCPTSAKWLITEKGCLDATRHPRHEYVSLDTPLDGSRLHLVGVVGLRTEFKGAEYILSKCSPRGPFRAAEPPFLPFGIGYRVSPRRPAMLLRRSRRPIASLTFPLLAAELWETRHEVE